MGMSLIDDLFHSCLHDTTCTFQYASSRALQYERSRAWFETHRMHSRQKGKETSNQRINCRWPTFSTRTCPVKHSRCDTVATSSVAMEILWPMKMHHSFGLRFCFAVCKTTCLADTTWELAVACKTRTLIFSPMTHKRTSEIVDSIDYI